jgi:hypothetical protein
MELLLNIVWLILAQLILLTCWLVPKPGGKAGNVGRCRLLVLSGCLSALLCPVVSASDDLSALRTDMEESSSQGSSVKKSTTAESAARQSHVPTLAEAVRIALVRPERESGEQVPAYCIVFTIPSSAGTMGCRAPPHHESWSLIASSRTAQFLSLDFVLQTLQQTKEARQWMALPMAALDGLRRTKCKIYPSTTNRYSPRVLSNPK